MIQSNDLKRVRYLLDIAPLFKSHAKHGLQALAKVYTKNVAPSGIISVSKKKFSGYKNSYFISEFEDLTSQMVQKQLCCKF